MQVIEIPDTAPRGRQVASPLPDDALAALEYHPAALLDAAEVLAVTPLDGSGAGVISALPFSTRTVSADTVATPGELLKVNATGGEVVISPPPHPAAGTYLTVLKIDPSANAVTWGSPVGDDGEGAQIVSPLAAATFVYDGAGWFVEAVNTSFNAATAGGISAEGAQDATASLFAAGSHTGISFVYNDAGDALSATVAAPSWTQVTSKPTFAAVATSGSASDLSTGTLSDAVIPAGIARDSEVSAAVSAAQRTYVQSATPSGPAPYLWVQTGLPGGNITIWVEDGS